MGTDARGTGNKIMTLWRPASQKDLNKEIMTLWGRIMTLWGFKDVLGTFLSHREHFFAGN